MLRSYRVILEVDVEIEVEEETEYEGIEEQLEDRDNWQAYCNNFDSGYVNHAKVDSFDVGWEY